jgi:hypothetical protein
MTKVRYAKFNESFFSEYDQTIIWYDKKGVLKLNEEINVEITLVTGNITGRYEGYKVVLINKKSGIVTEHYFNFDTYMKKRIDNRSDYTQGFCILDNVVNEANDYYWYIAKPDPKEVTDMAQTIIGYIYLYE